MKSLIKVIYLDFVNKVLIKRSIPLRLPFGEPHWKLWKTFENLQIPHKCSHIMG